MPSPCTYSVAPAILEAAQPRDMMPMFLSDPVLAVFCLLCAAFFAAGLVRVMINLAVLDHPGHRSAHENPTPKGGGVGVMAAFFLFFPLVQDITGHSVLRADVILTALATALLACVSWLDDLYQWPASIKFVAQCVAATMVVAGGTALPWPTPLVGAILSVLWLVFLTNAVNFMDGLNGLISGCLMVGNLLVAAMGLYFGVPDLIWPALLLAGCLCGFLPFNFPKARIFLGDVGSQGCGLLAGTAALYMTQHSTQPSGWLLGPALLFPLIFDVLFTLCRRKLAGYSLIQAHRGHLYQVLHRSGMNPVLITLCEWSFVCWGGLVAFLAAPLPPLKGTILAFVLLMLPQLGWLAFATVRTRRHPVGPW
ncbi:MraY family glycosyltransferase [Acetobacter indonesiensis]|uniref:UDP-phosphate alpha-N-acetylglucosaminephosphotransferase n=1 Tax=Acetobacter indonesiensis TaxID=104101 RepID=A0A252ATZ5_9PROT|nr:UDP-phosphate alpha-N-acetylglucosaminephosphotransferase [Acetobacter indonesiensis]OUI93706.1 UDP-phosphate alpha-N-acetylglucosaminephosphotransferase [Acetobacter indonesiensis]